MDFNAAYLMQVHCSTLFLSLYLSLSLSVSKKYLLKSKTEMKKKKSPSISQVIWHALKPEKNAQKKTPLFHGCSRLF